MKHMIENHSSLTDRSNDSNILQVLPNIYANIIFFQQLLQSFSNRRKISIGIYRNNFRNSQNCRIDPGIVRGIIEMLFYYWNGWT